jgi:hypothetical protein
MNWNLKEEVGSPKPKYATTGNITTMTVSTEVIVSDGESVWHENYCFEEDSDHFENSNITHWIEIDKIPVPKN